MPMSLQQLMGFVSRPPPVQQADYGSLVRTEENRQKLTDERQAMADARAKAQAAEALARQQEQGRMARAGTRQAFQEKRLGFEQEQAGAHRAEERRVVLETAYQKLRDAQDRGDQEGIDFARQIIQRLGEEVTGGQPAAPGAPEPPGAPSPEPAQPEAPPAPAAPPPPRAAPPALSGRNLPPAAPRPQPPPTPPGPETVGLPMPTFFMAPEAGGAVTSGMAANRPPQGVPFVQGQDIPQPAPPVSAPPVAPVAAPGVSLRRPAPAAPPEPPPSAQAAAPALNSPGRLDVLRNGTPVLSLGAGGARQQVERDFQPLISSARTAQEVRAAKLALETARSVVEREGPEKAREAGMAAYKFEIGQQTARDTAAQRAASIRISAGEGEYGGTGKTKGELDINDRDYKKVNDYIQKKSVASGMSEMGKNENGFRSVLVAGKSGGGTGQLAAVTKSLKAMGNSGAMSDKDLERIMRSAGMWESFSNAVNKAMTGELPPALVKNVIEMARASLAAIQNRRDQIGTQAYNDMMANEFLSEGGRRKSAEYARDYFSGAQAKAVQDEEAPAARPQPKTRGDGQKKAPPGGAPPSADGADAFFFGR